MDYSTPLRMRKRASSMYCEPEEKLDDSEIYSDCDETINHNIANVLDEDGWCALYDMNILNQVKWQIPVKDRLPYDERMKKINWHKIKIEDKSSQEISNRFNELIGRTRNFRILNEILDDVRKLTVQNECPTKTTPLALFIKDNKEKLMKEVRNSGGKANFSRLVSEKYKTLSEKERQVYKQQAKETVQQYKDTAAQFRFVKKVGRPDAQIDGPIKLFIEEEFSNDVQCSMADIRKKYLQLSKEKKLELILKYLDVTSDVLSLEQYEKAKQILTKEEMNYIDEYEKRPKKQSAYNIFMKTYFEKVKNESTPWKEKFSQGANKWKHLSDSKKQHYQNLADKIRDNYDDEFLNFVSSLPKERQAIEIRQVISKKGTKRRVKRDQSTLDESLSQSKKTKLMDDSEDNSEIIDSSNNAIFNLGQQSVLDESLSKSKKGNSVEKAEHSSAPIGTPKNVKKNSKSRELPSEVTSQLNKFLEQKPPDSTLIFYTQNYYDGPANNAKATYKSLSKKQKDKIKRKFEKARTKYLQEVKDYVDSLPPNQASTFVENMGVNLDVSELDTSILTN